jgi:hypothetical protein
MSRIPHSIFAEAASTSREPDSKVQEMVVPLHENPLIVDYIRSRHFNGFQIKIRDGKVNLITDDSTILSLLHRAKILKEEKEDDIVEVDVMTLLPKRSALKKSARDSRWHYEPETVDLVEALNSIHAFSDPAVKQRLSDGIVQYGDMPVLFPRGSEAVVSTPSGLAGGVVDTCVEVNSFFGNYYNISMTVVLPTSKGSCLGKVQHRVYDFDPAIMQITKMNVRPITPEEKTFLTERGKVFRHFTKEPTPITYTGNMTIPGFYRDHVIGADGRAMVDAINYAQLAADNYYDIMRDFQIDEEATANDVRDDDLWRCHSRVHGFSMRLKRWGWLDVEGIKPVNWRDDAFEKLVLETEQKASILHLVTHYGKSFSDFIEGKSGGLVFLLNGPPGTGKTLTAEAVAETLHRPLYSVSVGELGTSPDELEGRLRSILDLAFQWNAVLLLDEADIFMEARDTNNIQRNAMVSIFLRLLEYYSGVLFLTTNRVGVFDPAFFSRISLAINYPKLAHQNRESVWNNVLTSAGIATTGFDMARLASYEVNGRNIKNAVRIAQTMAAGDENRTVTQDDIEKVLSLTEQFNKLLV